MRNLINFDVRGDCACACVACIFDGSESIRFIFEANEYIKPQMQLAITDGETITVDLLVENNLAIYDFDISILHDGIKFTVQYLDVGKVGATFNFRQKYDLSSSRTLKVYDQGGHDLMIYCTQKYKMPDFSDDFDIDEDGKISIKQMKIVAGENVKVDEAFDEETNTTTYTISSTGGGGKIYSDVNITTENIVFTDTEGVTETFELTRDDNNRITSFTDADGNVTSITRG